MKESSDVSINGRAGRRDRPEKEDDERKQDAVPASGAASGLGCSERKGRPWERQPWGCSSTW
jgi:hypothetical protein